MNGEHGYGPYTRGCRCDACRKAKADYMREARRAGRERAARFTKTSNGKRGSSTNTFAPGAERHFVDGIKHGRHGFEVHGCRCRDCTTAHSQSDRRVDS